jgi:hypothetical protein
MRVEMTMLTERLRRAIDRAAETTEAHQDAVAGALERLIGVFMDDGKASMETDQEPAVRPEVAALLEQSIREHAEPLERLKRG